MRWKKNDPLRPPERKIGRPRKWAAGFRTVSVVLGTDVIDWLDQVASTGAKSRSEALGRILTGSQWGAAADRWDERYLIAEGMTRGAEIVVHLREPVFVGRLYRAVQRSAADLEPDVLHLPTGDALAQIHWLCQPATADQLKEVASTLGRHLAAYRVRT